MFIKSSIIALTLAATGFARELIIERDGRPIYPRRFGQEQCGGIGGQIGSACNGAICGVLGGRVPGTLLAAADPCAQQDLADDIINASKTQDAATAANLVALAVKFRQCEKNTPPDFTTNPPALRNSVFCLKAPANSELDGLVQAQDPANDPDLFFDVETKSTIRKGDKDNTFPFGQAPGNGNTDQVETTPAAAATTAVAAESSTAAAESSSAATEACAPAATVTVTAEPKTSDAATGTCTPPSTVTVTVPAGAAATTTAAAAETTSSAAEATTTAAPTPAKIEGALDFGSCTNPAVEFGPGFDGRKLAENSFQPENRNEFAQSSALNGQIVLNAICNILNDKCKAPAATVAACRAAIDAVANVSGGAKADQFNGALGIQSNFAQVPAAVGGGQGSIEAATTANFNQCDVPKIAFGIFDGRTENSFAPASASFVHGSALNPNIITQFVCDQVKGNCNANQVAIDDCNAAIAATSGKTGQDLVDAFNAAVSANVA